VTSRSAALRGTSRLGLCEPVKSTLIVCAHSQPSVSRRLNRPTCRRTGPAPARGADEVFTFRWGPTSRFEPPSSSRGAVTYRYGGALAAPTRAASVVRRRRRDLVASPAASRRRPSSWGVAKASATARLRTTSAQARKRDKGTSPITLHQPLATSTVAGSLIRALAGAPTDQELGRRGDRRLAPGQKVTMPRMLRPARMSA